MAHDNWLDALEEAVSDVELNGRWVDHGFDYAYGSEEGFQSEVGYEIDEHIEIDIAWTSEARECFEEMESDRTMTKKVPFDGGGMETILVRVELMTMSAKRNGWSGYKWAAKYAVSNS